MTRLIFIHGINSENRTVDQIQSEWGDALNKGMRAAGLEEIPLDNIECAYYGKLLAEGAKKWSKSRGIGDAESSSSNQLYREFEKELEQQFVPRATVELTEESRFETASSPYGGQGKARGASSSNYANLYQASQTPNSSRAAIPHKGGLIKSAKILEMISPRLAKSLIGKFLKQAIAYLEDEELHRQVNQTVVDQLFSDESKKDEPHIVVTHSNGTLLSHFLFADALKDWNIRAWYTIGSPLGAKTMQSYLPDLNEYPGRVQTWYNCWDKEDFVSYNTPLTKDTIGIDGIVNLNTFDTDYEDKHSIVSYLSHAMLARLIAKDYL